MDSGEDKSETLELGEPVSADAGDSGRTGELIEGYFQSRENIEDDEGRRTETGGQGGMFHPLLLCKTGSYPNVHKPGRRAEWCGEKSWINLLTIQRAQAKTRTSIETHVGTPRASIIMKKGISETRDRSRKHFDEKTRGPRIEILNFIG